MTENGGRLFLRDPAGTLIDSTAQRTHLNVYAALAAPYRPCWRERRPTSLSVSPASKQCPGLAAAPYVEDYRWRATLDDAAGPASQVRMQRSRSLCVRALAAPNTQTHNRVE